MKERINRFRETADDCIRTARSFGTCAECLEQLNEKLPNEDKAPLFMLIHELEELFYSAIIDQLHHLYAIAMKEGEKEKGGEE